MGTSKYLPLSSADADSNTFTSNEKTNYSGSRNRPWILRVIVLLLLALSASTGFLLGHSFSKGREKSIYNIDKWTFTLATQSFAYNETFSQAPSPETDAAWMTIFPPHGGFFHDKTVAPNGASLAVYHQLHCLDAIRHAYWILHDAVVQRQNLSFSELADWYTPWHTRHCIDFLRQMLMCNADVTIEHNDPDIGGIRGFGISHQCKKWDDVVQWTLDRQRAGENQGYVYPSDAPS